MGSSRVFTSTHPHDIEQLRQLLRTNSPPPDSYFRSAIVSSASDLARYDDEIHAMQEALSQLISERQILQEYSDGCRSLFAPVRRLPTEILTEIFALCRPTQIQLFNPLEDFPQDEDERAAQSHLLPLAQVCWRWYETVIGTPGLRSRRSYQETLIKQWVRCCDLSSAQALTR
ncbi:hypothetical protein DFH06DRAFT_1172973 [Mycena polygramma]|nr:hypothetical protein DFH06DRAFT_1172973 [Mycena polygramma]